MIAGRRIIVVESTERRTDIIDVYKRQVLGKADDYGLQNGRRNDAFLRDFMGVLTESEIETMRSGLLRLGDQAARLRQAYRRTTGED